MGITPTKPSNSDICAYIEFLASDSPSPRTIANQLSHVRTYLRKAYMTTSEVDHHRVNWAMTAVKRDNQYQPRIKRAFPVNDLHRMVVLLPDTPRGNLTRVAVLLMYYAALRQSEVLAPSMSNFDSRKHLTRADITFHHQEVLVHIKHAKNMQSVYETKTVCLGPAPNPLLCVVTALKKMIEATPTLATQDPCIMFPVTRKPVPIDYVRRTWKTHLEINGMDTTALSLHSIRKSAASAAYQQGCPELDIQRYGGWRSGAYRTYITTAQSNVNHAIVEALNSSS